MSESTAPVILIPTALEAERLSRAGDLGDRVHLTGVGPVAAAARTAEILRAERPSTAILIGIAGSYDEFTAPLGSAVVGSRVSIEGIGVGVEDAGLALLGMPQWAGDDATPEIGDTLDLQGSGSSQVLILTVCAASADRKQAALRARRHPGAVVEEMEGFGAALACALQGVRLSVVRGVSNAAGDRDRSRWRIDDALNAAFRELRHLGSVS